jgi:flap endonuclease-1
LLGCDYCDSIRGIGPKRALELIRKHGNIEGVVENLDTDKYAVPENFNYQEARQLFLNPNVIPAADVELTWSEPDEEGIKAFLVGEKQFSESRVMNALKRIKKGDDKRSQGRIDSFFSAAPKRAVCLALIDKCLSHAATYFTHSHTTTTTVIPPL